MTLIKHKPDGSIDFVWLFPRIMIGAYIFTFLFNWLLLENNVDPSGKPFGFDFIAFWSAGKLALSGAPAAAFDPTRLSWVQQLVAPGMYVPIYYHYPPTFLPVASVLALLPYNLAYIVFAAGTFALSFLMLRRLLPDARAIAWIAAFPGAFVTAYHGQNSALSCAIMAGAILLIDRRPLASGVLIGLLVYKPQLGLLFPLALVIAWRWRTIVAAGATAACIVTLSVVLFGLDTWRAFFANIPFASYMIESHIVPWSIIPSAWSFARTLGFSQQAAYGFHFAVAMGAVGVVAWVWWRCGASRLAFATLVSATLLLPHYTFNYEMMQLAIPLAILAPVLARDGVPMWHRALAGFAYVTPMLLLHLPAVLHFQFGFLAILAMLLLSASYALEEVGVRADSGRVRPAAPDMSLGRLGIAQS